MGTRRICHGRPGETTMDTVEAPSLTDDLRDYLYRIYEATPGPERRHCRWVVSLEWLNEVRKIDADKVPAWLAASPIETILCLPIDVREDAGAPWLEPWPWPES